MSGLTALLEGRESAAVWRWTGREPAEEVRRAVTDAGWAFGAVDGWTLTGRDQVLGEIGAALMFPEHFGRNLDALADCLADLADDTVLLWDGWAVLWEEDLVGLLGVLAVLADHCVATEHSGPRLAVLLRGDGPELPGVNTL